ncbi:alpha-amylase [Alteromonas sp. 345S023]|uniref:Alpha-amylase n=1 Tax=Alteromonas profundi TaxID=2696062 RepID=A0A7X5LNN2_9ALTE|nr:glycoside hydrolase family 13 protein [Alteromonas profundi]NDV92708.1 alpha-amylase [Alteromonas profundi]
MSVKAAVCVSTLLSTFAVIAKDTVEVYPPNWWAGMASAEVELMLHGDGIADDTVLLNAENVKVSKVAALDSDNYLFVTLNTEGAHAQTFELTINDADGSSRSIDYQLKARTEGAKERHGFDPTDAIYLLTPDRFANGNRHNDNIKGYKDKLARKDKGGRHGGDIEGIIEHIDYISEMGFTQIWSMPLLENNMDAYSYHGYAITDYYQIDPRYGSNSDYVTLSKKAKAAGVGVIMDMVLNHVGSEHPWMNDTPSDDWFNNQGNFVGTTHRREALHDPHAIESDIRGFSDGWFVPTMPDLNQRNPHLATYLIQNAIWWVEYAQLSGIRVDTYSYPDKAFLAKWTQRITQEYPNLNIVGEEWTINPAITAYWQAGSQRYDNYASALPSVMDFPLQDALVKGLNEPEGWGTGLVNIYQTLANDFLYGAPNNLVVFADNHDMSRIYTQVNHDLNKWNMAMTFFLTVRGIPQVFYGSEILMQNEGSEDHGVIRSDFAGGWPDNKQKSAFTGKGLSDDERWAQQRIKALLALRKQFPALFTGAFKHYAPKAGTYTYFRTSDVPGAPRLMVILNKGQKQSDTNTHSSASTNDRVKPTQVPLTQYSEMLKGYSKLERVSDGAVFNVNDTLTLDPMSAQIFVVR